MNRACMHERQQSDDEIKLAMSSGRNEKRRGVKPRSTPKTEREATVTTKDTQKKKARKESLSLTNCLRGTDAIRLMQSVRPGSVRKQERQTSKASVGCFLTLEDAESQCHNDLVKKNANERRVLKKSEEKI